MKQLKKTLLTLVALLAVTTGAWADEEVLLTTITPTAKTTYSETTSGVVTVTHDNNSFLDEYGWLWKSQPGSLTVEAKEGYTITRCVFSQPYDKAPVTVSSAPFKVNFVYNEENEKYLCEGTDPDEGMDGVASIEVYGYAPAAASSGPEVTWTAATKTGSFTMPGGNVTLEPDYYPQATAAEGAVTATTDVKATTDAPLVTIDETKLTGAKKLMYYVSTDATAPAYDAVGWTDVLPTAENYTEAATLNVWYYPVGTDGDTDETTYSNGDICATALTVSLGAAPTYDVTLNAEGLSTDEAAAWKVAKGTDQPAAFPLEGVTKGTAVTVTYSGSKKVIGVKAEKKAESLIVNPVVGQIIGSDGKNYAYGSLPTGVTAVAKICYVSGSNGLALALTDEETKMNWSTAIETCAAHTPAITGGTWKLATKDEWSNMITAAGSHTALRDGFSSVGGTNMKEDYPYWSSTENGSDNVWIYSFSYGIWSKNNNSVGYVRACLAF